MIGIELFAGSGGMGHGAKLAGIDVKLAVEKDIVAAQTYLNNHKDTTVVVEDIRNIKEFKLRKNDEIILFGGPPCQGYSKLNRKTRTAENPNNWLFLEFMRSVKMINPEWVVIENVPGLTGMEKGFFLESICDNLQDLGYTPNFKILNAADFGVPQKRERLFIIASKSGVAFQFPKGDFINNHITVAQALNDLPNLQNGTKAAILNYKNKARSDFAIMMRGTQRKATQNYVSKNTDVVIERYQYIKQGGNWKDIPDRLMANYKDHKRCHHGIYRRLKEDEPAFVIANYRKSMLIHPIQDRGLSVREAARLQSFPDNYNFYGSLDQKQQQVGNAVPPLLAKAIFEQILKN